MKSKYGKVLRTALYEQNYVVLLSSKRGGSTPQPPLGAPLALCMRNETLPATAQNLLELLSIAMTSKAHAF